MEHPSLAATQVMHSYSSSLCEREKTSLRTGAGMHTLCQAGLATRRGAQHGGAAAADHDGLRVAEDGGAAGSKSVSAACTR